MRGRGWNQDYFTDVKRMPNRFDLDEVSKLSIDKCKKELTKLMGVGPKVADCVMLFSIVICGELFNTAIETIVDMVSPEKNEKAKIAKDVSAGAVLVVAIGAAIVGGIIFIPKILEMFF